MSTARLVAVRVRGVVHVARVRRDGGVGQQGEQREQRVGSAHARRVGEAIHQVRGRYHAHSAKGAHPNSAGIEYVSACEPSARRARLGGLLPDAMPVVAPRQPDAQN